MSWIRCAVRDCEGVCTHELLTPTQEPFFQYDGEGLYICASHATDFEESPMTARPITVDEEGRVELA